MQTIFDSKATTHPVRMHINTARGRVNFYTDQSSKHEAHARLRAQFAAKWFDLHHAHVAVL